jgi:hypothetical protein
LRPRQPICRRSSQSGHCWLAAGQTFAIPPQRLFRLTAQPTLGDTEAAGTSRLLRSDGLALCGSGWWDARAIRRFHRYLLIACPRWLSACISRPGRPGQAIEGRPGFREPFCANASQRAAIVRRKWGQR